MKYLYFYPDEYLDETQKRGIAVAVAGIVTFIGKL